MTDFKDDESNIFNNLDSRTELLKNIKGKTSKELESMFIGVWVPPRKSEVKELHRAELKKYMEEKKND